jgi:glycerol-3-phosphate O-acyltransferase / dihydroxyacetone phosphate acyltransferase
MSLFLFAISLPGLALWLPVTLTTFYAVHNFKKTGPIWDTWDEIAQYKLIYGLFSGLCVWFGATLLTLPIAPFTFVAVPITMWLSLRWTEDAISSVRAAVALARMLRVGQGTLERMRERRRGLHTRVAALAGLLGLPADPERYFAVSGRSAGEKGRMRGKWDSRVRYFSVRRRRKRDWEEILRLYDKQDYPID